MFNSFSYFLVLTFLLFSFPLNNLAQNNGRVATSSSISATDGSTPWLSPSGDFAFGFKKIQENKNQFLLCIWYAKIQENTIVWHANISDLVPQGSRLNLDSQRGLTLADPQENTLWSTNLVASNVEYGLMNDVGNFVLMGSNSSDPLWESFGNPTNTLLPNQTLERGSFLVSQKSPTNFTQGRFYLRMLDNGNLVLVTQSVPSNKDYDDEYYNTQTSDATNVTNSGDKLVFGENGVVYVLRRNNQRQNLTPRSISSASDSYYRLTLNFDGVLSFYYHSRTSNSSGWSILWSQPDNICLDIDGDRGPGACGYNNVCNLGANHIPVCNCPKGYSLVDPSDAYGDCKPDFPISCDEVGRGSPEDFYSLITIRDTNWPKSDYELISPSTEQDCQSACLNDCFCAVVIFGGSGCWKKKFPLSNGRIDTNPNDKAFLKIRKDGVPIPPGLPNSGSGGSKNWKNLTVITSSLLGSSVLVNFLFISVFCWGFFHIYRKKMKTYRPTSHIAGSMCHSFTYKELVEATKDFKEELGRGAFAIVYKGVMPRGSRNVVAIKKLDRVADETEKEFMTEVNVISQTHHKNLVRLLGYCNEGAHRLLVYEYMSNGSLASFIFGDQKPSWSQRTNIAMGIARGLAYLHEECITQIIHCDIKPQNILLDDHHIARISDFGLSKLLMINQSRTNTNIRGTKGYVAPEWFRHSKVTVKVDVYSFGVLLLEIITCRKNYEIEYGPEAILTDWILDCFQEGKLEALVEFHSKSLNDNKQLERFVMVAIWCIQEDPSTRPTVRKVCQMLEGSLEVTYPPCPYNLSIAV